MFLNDFFFLFSYVGHPGRIINVAFCLGVCLSVCIETAESIGPTFCVGPHKTPGKVSGCLEFKKVVSKKNFNFCKSLKIHVKILLNLRTFFFNRTKRRCSQIELQLKIALNSIVKYELSQLKTYYTLWEAHLIVLPRSKTLPQILNNH